MNIFQNLKKIYSNEILENKLDKIRNSFFTKIDSSLSPERLESYTNNVNTYIKILETYIIKRNEYFKEINEIIKLNVIVVNYGTIKAKDIDVYIDIPGICKFIEEIPEQPEKPTKPPRDTNSDFYSGVFSTIRTIIRAPTIVVPSVRALNNSPVSNYNVIVDDQQIKIHIGELKQGNGYKVDDIYIKLCSHEEPMNLELTYEIVVGEPSKNFEGDLKLNINPNQ